MKKKIHEMKFYILYNYKSVLEATISKLFPFIDDNTTSITANNNFRISVIKRICIKSFTGVGENPCLIISTSTLSATVDSKDLTQYHFIINLKDRQINGITYVRNSAIPHKIRNSRRSWTLFKNIVN